MPPLAVIHATDRSWTDAEYRNRKPKGFPSKLRGVYLIYDDVEALQYVGVAMWCFDKRVWTHDDHIKRHYIDIVPFGDAWIHLALALEFWLIQAFKPIGNKTYQGYGFGSDGVHDPIPSHEKSPSG
jgi:hypothetical protein